MAAAVKCLVFYLLSNVCYCSSTAELLETVMPLLNDCARFYPHVDLNMAQNLIVRLEVAVDSVQHLVDSLDRGTQANAGRIPPLESLVRQLQHLLHRWEMLALRAVSCTSVRPIRTLATPSASNAGVGRPAHEISIPQVEFLRNRMRFTWPQISRKLLVSRATLWRRVTNSQSFSSRCYYKSLTDSDLDQVLRHIKVSVGIESCTVI